MSQQIRTNHAGALLPDWQVHGSIVIDGTERTIWKYESDEHREVFQITTGEPPSSEGGYQLLESLLELKGVKLSDVVPAASGMRP